MDYLQIADLAERLGFTGKKEEWTLGIRLDRIIAIMVPRRGKLHVRLFCADELRPYTASLLLVELETTRTDEKLFALMKDKVAEAKGTVAGILAKKQSMESIQAIKSEAFKRIDAAFESYMTVVDVESVNKFGRICMNGNGSLPLFQFFGKHLSEKKMLEFIEYLKGFDFNETE